MTRTSFKVFNQLVAMFLVALMAAAIMPTRAAASTPVDWSGSTASVTGGEITVLNTQQLEDAINNLGPAANVTIRLGADITHNAPIIIPADANITLTSDATPRTLTRGGFIAAANRLIDVAGTLTLEDITIDGASIPVNSAIVNVLPSGNLIMNTGATIQNGSNSDWMEAGGVTVYGSFIINNGTITGNEGDAGGVFIDNNATFTINGGTITGNTATFVGGGVHVNTDAVFIMNGGGINNNDGSLGGGGVFIRGDGSFTLNSGTITGNTANGGGGVFVESTGTFTMTGGSINSNTAAVSGGGVVVEVDAIFTLGGPSIISGNLLGASPSNLLLEDGALIIMGTGFDTPGANMVIGISTDTPSGVIVQSGALTYHPLLFTVNEPPAHTVAWNTGGQLIITPNANTRTITYNSNTGGGPLVINTIVSGANYPIGANTFIAPAGHNFAGWNTAPDGTGTPHPAGTTINNVTANTTLYAQWMAAHASPTPATPAPSTPTPRPSPTPSPSPTPTPPPALPYIWVELSQGLTTTLETLLGPSFGSLEININSYAPDTAAGIVVTDISFSVEDEAVNTTLNSQLPGILQEPDYYYTIFANLSAFVPTGINYHRIVALQEGILLGGGISQPGMVFSVNVNTTGTFEIAYIATLRRLVLSLDSLTITDLAGNIPNRTMDIRPIVQNNRTLVPLRFIAEALGAEVDWTPASAGRPLIVHMTQGSQTLNIPIREITPELAALGMDVPAQIMNGRTLVPLRFISEFFGAVVSWDAATRGIEIIYCYR